ncbi:cytochrome P450 [Pilimelia columellifera]|uniref:Cytochrome P450 n=1 Tax=Pilimelia columellifera subsp. columellifera TaxID=706583 RepID=A0ABP6AYL7_9ACTN
MLCRTWGEAIEADWPPVAEVSDPVGGRHLLVSSHALVREVLGDPVRFRPDNALDALTPIPISALRVLARHGFRLPPTLANNGDESHPRLRALVAEALHPRRVEQQRGWLTDIVRERVVGLTTLLERGEPVDLYADLAADLPLRVLARLIALPESDTAVVKEFSRSALELFWAPLDTARQEQLADTVGRYHTALRQFAATGGGLAGQLRELAGSVDVAVGALFFLLVAGQETTSQFLTLLLHRLVGEPAALAALAGGLVSAADVVEEGLRLAPPIVTWRRVAGVDTILGGTPVPKGTSVVLWLAAAGRDGEIVADRHGFVPGQRGSRRHLAFGAGAHRCVGAQLARMEATVVVEQTATVLGRVAVTGAPWCPDNLSFRMPDRLVVRLAAPGR